MYPNKTAKNAWKQKEAPPPPKPSLLILFLQSPPWGKKGLELLTWYSLTARSEHQEVPIFSWIPLLTFMLPLESRRIFSSLRSLWTIPFYGEKGGGGRKEQKLSLFSLQTNKLPGCQEAVPTNSAHLTHILSQHVYKTV